MSEFPVLDRLNELVGRFSGTATELRCSHATMHALQAEQRAARQMGRSIRHRWPHLTRLDIIHWTVDATQPVGAMTLTAARCSPISPQVFPDCENFHNLEDLTGVGHN